ncbi:MAG: hypothetical protein O7C74_03860 [Acidobacteria bacterium]|nr:hypothetical protein [Acidobacteriota bacterium]
MPKSLTQFLQISGQVSIRQVREARRAQRFFGGSLLYNLARLKILSELKAQDLLSEWMELPYAPLVDLIAIPPEVLQFIDPKVAAHRRVLPFQPDPERLFMATARMGNDAFYRDLEGRIGLSVTPHAIMEEHLAPLLEKHYGIPTPIRETIRVAKVNSPMEHIPRDTGGDQVQSETADVTSPDVTSPAVASTNVASTDTASTEMGLDGLPLDSDANPDLILPTESHNPSALLGRVETIADSVPPVPIRENTGAALDEGEVTAPWGGMESPLERLACARNRADIGEAAVDHALSLGIPRIALLGRRRESLVGWHAGGSGVMANRFANLTIPFYTPSIFAGFKITGNPYTGVIPDQPANLELLGALGKGAAPRVVAAVPVRLGDRTVAAIYADGGPAATTVVAQEPLVQLAGKIAAALEILILRGKILA